MRIRSPRGALGAVRSGATSSRRHTVLVIAAVAVPVLATILGVHVLAQSTRLRMDASRLVADVQTKVDEQLFISWQGVAGTANDAALKGEAASLRGTISDDLAGLRADGVDGGTVDMLVTAVASFDKALVVGVVQVNGGSVDVLSKQTLTVLTAYEGMHAAANGIETALVSQEDISAIVQEIGTTALIVGVSAMVLGLVWTTQRRRRNDALAHSETEALRRSEKTFRVLFEDSPRAMWVLDPAEHTVLAINNNAITTYGYSGEEVIGTRFDDLIAAAPESDDPAAALDTSRGHAVGVTVDRHRLKDGRVIDVEVRSDLLDFNGHRGLLMLAEDVTERNDLERQLRHQAFHDPLTGLPNRELFRERAQHALARGGRTGMMCAVVILDLDDFKTVNDSLGHLAGDDLLRQVAHRLPAFTRPGDTVARLGGDEFAVLIEDVTGPAQAATVAERMTAAMQDSFDALDNSVFVSASMGIAVSAADGSSTPNTLLRDADVAMYAAKARGEGGWAIFGADMHRQVQSRLELRGALGRAIENEELVVHYQPLVDLRTHEITGVEALVRWNHPTRGLLPPSDFITLAEETGKISSIGGLVLRSAAAQVSRWQQSLPSARPLDLSVNASFRELIDENFVERTLTILSEAGLDPHQLTIEMTESMLMQDPARAIATLDQLRRHGIQIAMDDFGTGYSSLTYLRQMPLDVVKIDRSFVMSIGGGHDDVSMTVAIVRLLDTLNVITVAEGIETTEQLAYVSSMGCDRGQGYLFSRPVAAAALEMLLDAPLTPAAAA